MDTHRGWRRNLTGCTTPAHTHTTQSPDGFPTHLLPNVDCGCCFKPNQQKPFTLGGDRNEPFPRVFGPHEYLRPTFQV